MNTSLHERLVQLNKSLPIHITSEDAERNPQFLLLLEQFSEHINYEGISKKLENQIEAKKNELHLERKKFLMNSILCHELQSLCIEHIYAKKSTSIPLEIWNAFQHLYHIATVQENISLQTEENKSMSILGITSQQLQEQFEQNFPSHKVSLFIKDHLGILISKSCIEKVKQLYQFYSPLEYQHLQSQFQSFMQTQKSFEKEEEELYIHMANDLVQQIINEKQKLKKERELFIHEQQQLDMEYWFLYRQMNSCLEMMEHLLEEYRLGRYKQIFEVQCQWLQQKVQTMVAKLQVLKLQYICETYDQETVTALHKLKHRLESQMTKLNNEVHRMEHKLVQYKSLGKEFGQLIDEYTKVLATIDHNQQILKRLV